MNLKKHRIGIFGAGGWGTSLAALLSNNHHSVILWTHEEEVNNEINSNHGNSIYLKGVGLPETLKCTLDPKDLSDSDIIVIAIPTQYIRETIIKYGIKLDQKIVVSVAKGIEKDSYFRGSEILKDVAGVSDHQYVILTGPSHAEEVSRNLATTVVAASKDNSSAVLVQNTFTTPNFRVYTTDDVIGCEIGGSLKNVIAIAAGMIDGLQLGDNTKAALITRGLAEMSRLGVALGADPLTFSGLSGLGDLYVTCSSKFSRNRFVGEEIGRGKKITQITNEMKMVAEGVTTTKSAHFLAVKHNVELPIVNQVYKILFEDNSPLEALKKLMTRETKREWW